MSVKNSSMVAGVASALGLTVAANAMPISESLLNDMAVLSFDSAEVDALGKCIAIVGVKDAQDATVLRPVADSLGNVKLYSGADSVMSAAKRSNLGQGVPVRFVRATKVAVVGDPVQGLKSKHKSYTSEKAAAEKAAAIIANKKTAATALGWNTQTGTPERAEYDDIVLREQTTAEWKTFVTTKVAQLATALTNAGIDPVTYLPLPPQTP